MSWETAVPGFGWLLLALAVVGSLASSVYLAMVLVAAWRFRRRLPRTTAAALPPVSILKPLCGFEPQLESNLETFFVQDYPAGYELLFAMRSPEDGALAAVESLRRRYPSVPAHVVFTGPPRHANPKVTSLEDMAAAARHDIIAISDSDIRVAPDFLRRVVPPLLAPSTGLVTCLYRGVRNGSFWSLLEAMQMSIEMPSGVLVAEMLEGMKFALGAVMVTRRDALRAIGGIGRTGDFYSDDFVLGKLVAGAGYRVELSTYLPEHVLADETLVTCFRRQLRWNRSTRYSRPKGHVGTGLTYATPYGVLGAAAGVALGLPALGWSLLGFSVLRCIIQGLAVGGGVVNLRDYVAEAALYPLRDLIGFCAWAASFYGRDFVWRGERYRFGRGGRLQREVQERLEAAESVAAD